MVLELRAFAHNLNSDANQSIIFKELCRNLQLRGAQSAFAPSAQQQVLAYTSSHLWLKREADDQRIFVVASFSDAKSEISVPDEDTATGHAWTFHRRSRRLSGP